MKNTLSETEKRIIKINEKIILESQAMLEMVDGIEIPAFANESGVIVDPAVVYSRGDTNRFYDQFDRRVNGIPFQFC